MKNIGISTAGVPKIPEKMLPAASCLFCASAKEAQGLDRQGPAIGIWSQRIPMGLSPFSFFEYEIMHFK
jgi:hypothetical protein